MVNAFLGWLFAQGEYGTAVGYVLLVEEVLRDLEAGQSVTWGAYQEACRRVLRLASLASNNRFVEVAMAFDTVYERLGVLAGYEEGVSA